MIAIDYEYLAVLLERMLLDDSGPNISVMERALIGELLTAIEAWLGKQGK